MAIKQRKLSTEDLEGMRIRLPSLAEAANVILGPKATARPADLNFLVADMTIELAVSAAAALGAAVIFPEFTYFESARFLEDENADGSENELSSPVIDKAHARDGDLIHFGIYWSAGGLLCSWVADVSWVAELEEEWKADIGEQGAGIALKSEDGAPGWKSRAEKLVVEVMADPQFRGAAPRTRLALARDRLAPVKDEEHGYLAQESLRALSGRIAAEDARQERLLKPQFGELAERITHTEEWQASSQQTSRKQAASDFLQAEAEGWAMPPSLAELLRDMAAELSDDREHRLQRYSRDSDAR